MKHGRMEGDGAMCGVAPMPAQSPAGRRCGGCPAVAPPTGHGAGPQSRPQPLSGAHSPPFALSYQDSLLLSHQNPVNTQSQGKPKKRAKLLRNSQKPPTPRQPPPGSQHMPAPGGRAAALGPTRLPTSPTCPASSAPAASPARTPSHHVPWLSSRPTADSGTEAVGPAGHLATGYGQGGG